MAIPLEISLQFTRRREHIRFPRPKSAQPYPGSSVETSRNTPPSSLGARPPSRLLSALLRAVAERGARRRWWVAPWPSDSRDLAFAEAVSLVRCGVFRWARFRLGTGVPRALASLPGKAAGAVAGNCPATDGHPARRAGSPWAWLESVRPVSIPGCFSTGFGSPYGDQVLPRAEVSP